MSITQPLFQISSPNLVCLWHWTTRNVPDVTFGLQQNPRWRPAAILKRTAAILKKENVHNSDAFSDTFTKFGTLVAMGNPQRPRMSLLGYNKIQDGGRPPF